MGVFWLYRRILQAKNELEIRVQKRTVELHDANIELGESEARYRSIFEDSPISLREEDFSAVKQIIDDLRLAGVKEFRTYFANNPETLAECVRVVKVLNVNQNTLELFKTENKEMLYEGLTNIFTEESLASFGEQLIAFIEGETHFECETVQQTLTGEKLWAGTSVSIAPGYEETWAKVFVSILDITNRKRTEQELKNYREHLEELVTARTTELVALQHKLEQRVEERTEELAQVNIGLNAEITERKRLQEQVQRYTEELEQRVADRTRELSVLYDVTAVASNVLDLDELLSRSMERSLTAMRRKAGVIHLLDETESKLRLATQQGISTDISTEIDCLFSNQGGVREMFEGRSPFIIPDLVVDSSVPTMVRRSGWRTYTGVSIQDTGGQLLGVLSIFGETEHQLNAEEKTLLASIADHIGLAVENVRLRRQAEETAVLEDRQRLARELHDAVSQSLFSASVIAETLPRLWERNPVVVQQNLAELHRLIRGALAEMRTLLLELRPVSMAEAVLGDLLRQLADGITGRTQLDVALKVEGQGAIPNRVKKNLFRIAQEALNNVAKHARAQHAVINLNQTTDRITLYLGDDGQGFEPHRTEGSHLGLTIMRERAESIGATLTISSQPGQGTEIIASWPAESGGNCDE
jgi:PAS domain S-box-containing protein